MDTINMKQHHYCLGCLCHNSERDLECFKFHNGTFKAMFQENIYLCYVCKKIAVNMEHFVQNVSTNQLLMANSQTISDSTLKTTTGACQSVVNLSKVTLSSIETNESEYIDEPVVMIFSSRIKVKQEFKSEAALDQNLNLFYNNEFQDSTIKQDDDIHNETKDEDHLENINLKLLSKKLKKNRAIDDKKNNYNYKLKRKYKDFQNLNIKEDADVHNATKDEDNLVNGDLKLFNKKLKNNRDIDDNIYNDINQRKTEDCIVSVLHITKKQCYQERENMLKDPKYTNRVYRCENCVKGFTFKEAYEKHMEKHSKAMGDFECDICKQRMATIEKLSSHQKCHKIRYKCVECGLIRISRLTITEHYTAFHLNEGFRLSCPHCHKKFRRQVSLKKHIANLHRKRTRSTCRFCLKTYANNEVLKGHLIRAHPSEVTIPISHVCKECGRGFSAPSLLRNHMVTHIRDRNYLCVECNRTFKSDAALNRHLKVAFPHVNYMELPLSCSHCDKRFSLRRDVARHENRVHLNIKPYQCDKCDKAYINDWSLKEHKSYAHEGRKRPRKFPCPYCDKIFDRNATCKAHIRTHTGERPYSCKKCPARFSQASVLSTHVKLVHLKLTRDGRPKQATQNLM